MEGIAPAAASTPSNFGKCDRGMGVEIIKREMGSVGLMRLLCAMCNVHVQCACACACLCACRDLVLQPQNYD